MARGALRHSPPSSPERPIIPYLFRKREHLQAKFLNAAAAAAAALALAACATTGPTAGRATAATAAAPADTPAAAATSGPQRDLSAAEKKVIMDAVQFNLKDPQSAKYHWTKFPARTDESSRNYCATVDAKSPYPAYNGKQAYIVETHLANGQIVSATMGLIAGGKDVSIVANMCAKYGLDPNG
jgi:hypothetical protein